MRITYTTLTVCTEHEASTTLIVKLKCMNHDSLITTVHKMSFLVSQKAKSDRAQIIPSTIKLS